MRLSQVFVLLLLVIGFYSCQKPGDLNAGDLQPSEDVLFPNQTDTISLVTHVVKEDTLGTDELSACLLGTYNDDVFGKVICSFATEFTLSGENPDFPLTYEIDSVVLCLTYNGYTYGPISSGTIVVNPLTEQLDIDSNYNSSSSISISNENLVLNPEQTYTFQPNNYFYSSSTDSLLPQLRIPLKTQLGNSFFSPDNPNVLANDASFQEYFPGVLVSPGIDPMGVAAFNLTNINSKIAVYYRYDNNGVQDTTFYDFPITSECARFTKFKHFPQLASEPYLQNLFVTDTLDGNALTFIQAAAGTKTKISLPHLLDFQTAEGRIVNKAELIIPFEYEPHLPAPTTVFIFYKDNDGVLQALPDQFNGVIGGGRNDDTHEYRLVITQYIQKVLAGTLENHDLYVVAGSAGVSVNRVVLHGPNYSSVTNENMRLVLTLSN